MAKKKPKGLPKVSITYPADQQQVSGNGTFDTYGTVGQACMMFSYVFNMSGQNLQSGSSQQMPAGQWDFHYQNLPTNVWLHLVVSGTNSIGTGSQSITIKCVSP